MHEGEGRFDRRMGKVGIEGVDLVGDEHSLVHDGSAGKTREIVVIGPAFVLVRDRVLGTLADDVEGPLELGFVADGLSSPDENLPDEGHGRTGRIAEVGGVDRHRAPAEADQAFVRDETLDPFLDRRPDGRIAGQETHADAVFARSREDDAVLLSHLGEKAMGNLEKDAGAVSGVDLGSPRSSMIQIFKYGNGLFDDVVGFFAFDMGDETDAAGVVLVDGVIEPLLLPDSLRALHFGVVSGCLFVVHRA